MSMHERDETIEDIKFYLISSGVDLVDLRARRYQYVRNLEEQKRKQAVEQQKRLEREREERKKSNIDRFKQKMHVSVFDDSRGFLIERKWDEELQYVKKDSVGDEQFRVKTTPEELCQPIFENFGELPDSRGHEKEFDQAIFAGYNNKEYPICFPFGRVDSHFFRLRLAYEI